jgi:hypothetical protein
MTLKMVRWIPDFDFRRLSHLDGSLTNLVKGYKLKNNDAIVVTSKGWHRLRLIARMSDRAVMIIPETKDAVLDTLAEWVQLSLRDGVAMLSEYRKVA